MGWLLVDLDDRERHVVPDGDVVEHGFGWCLCDFVVEVVVDDFGGFSHFLVSHDAWDGRD